MKFINKTQITLLTTLILLGTVTGCKKYLDIPLPVDSIAANGAYVSDNSVSGVVTGLLYNMANSSTFGAPSNSDAIGYRAGLYTDELTNQNPNNTSNQIFYTDNLQSIYITQWSALYKQIYNCNLNIEGIRAAQANLINYNQWLGEALFCRAFLYFYLVNLFGDVPLTTTSDYSINNTLARSPQAAVYQQMITDLKEAQGLLSTNYLNGFSVVTVDRGRPNQYAVDALLARVYLYTGDYADAEAQATNVINATTVFQLVPPASAFLANSKETIFALAPTGANFVRDWGLYNNGMPSVLTTPTVLVTYAPASLSQSLVNLFDPADARLANWIRTTSTTTPVATYYFPNKYKSNVNGVEYLIALRLGEQYLIRAEARARQNNITGAQSDILAVRQRAGLGATTATTQADLITAVLKERQFELFTEFGHRFFDLKRTGNIDAVMNVVAPLKGGAWSSLKQIWPITSNDIVVDPNLTQAPGYN